MDEKGWDKIRGRLPAGFTWKSQHAKRKNKKGRAIGGMVMGIRVGIEVEVLRGNRMEGMMEVIINLRGVKWRMVGVYVREAKLEGMRDWMEGVGEE